MAQPKLVGITYNERAPEAPALVRRLADRLGGPQVCWSCTADEVEGFRAQMAQSRLAVTIGGDGTILRTVRVAAPYGVPLVGVNMGRVGFMTELDPDEAPERIAFYVEGQPRVEERMMLEARVTPEGVEPSEEGPPPFHGLNDVVVARATAARLIAVGVRVNGAPLTTYRADGVVVATATGSTGYTLSLGGPILHPDSQSLLLKPIAAHLGINAAIVLHPGAVVDLTPQMDYHPTMLSVDGFVDLALAPGDTVRVQRSRHVARFLRADPPSAFYTRLLHRLGLGGGGVLPRASEGA